MNFLKILKSLIPILGFTVTCIFLYTLLLRLGDPDSDSLYTPSGSHKVVLQRCQHRKRIQVLSSAQLVFVGESGMHSEDDSNLHLKTTASKLCLAFEFLHFNPQENQGINTATDLANGTLK